jgi:uncharacterized protein (DUF2147 family)
MDAAFRNPHALIEIKRDGGEIVGTIVELMPQAGEDLDPSCERCDGANRGRKIRGLAILFLGLSDGGSQYRGTILDPEEGTIYRCVVSIEGAGNRLVLRGYVGIPLLGRTETWIRDEGWHVLPNRN